MRVWPGKEEDGTGGVHHDDGWRFVVGGGVMGEMFNLDQIATLRAAPMACFFVSLSGDK